MTEIKIPNNYEQDIWRAMTISKESLKLINSIKSLQDAKQILINLGADAERILRGGFAKKLSEIIEGLKR
jgi:hypothetical protein